MFVVHRYEIPDMNYKSRATSGTPNAIKGVWEPGHESRATRAFTLIELIVAVGILAMVLSFAGVIFRVSIESHRTAVANAEIMRKLRAITDQLNADFKGLSKDGEIFVVWVAKPVPDSAYTDNDLDGYERFDRIMFFAYGDFQSYGFNHPVVRGNVARVCYMLAKRDGIQAEQQAREKRTLVRTQHILTADDDPMLANFILDVNTFGGSDQEWYDWNNRLEYDKVSLEAWKNIHWDMDPNDPRGSNQPCKLNILSVITDIKFDDPGVSETVWGASVNQTDPNSIHMLLCEGVGEFKIQGWYDAQQRWVPDVDPDGDGDLADTNFFLADPISFSVLLYPYPPNGGVFINNIGYPRDQVDKAHFDAIPGLGRALKFTFTLYDSKGVIKGGRTFTHIVYLGD